MRKRRWRVRRGGTGGGLRLIEFVLCEVVLKVIKTMVLVMVVLVIMINTTAVMMMMIKK